MSLTKCQYCDHGNPAGAKFCNACGATLTLAPCPHCGAVNQIQATTCYQCHGALSGGRTDDLGASDPAAVVSAPAPRRHARASVGIVVLAAVALLGFYAYRQETAVTVPAPPTASNEAKTRGNRMDAGASNQALANAVAPDAAAATTPSGTPPAGTVSAPATPVTSVPVVARPRATIAAKSAEPEPGPCTESLAALGLCTPKPNQRRE